MIIFCKMKKFRLLLIFCIALISPSTFGETFTHGDEYDVWPHNTKSVYDHKTAPESLCDLNKEIISFTCELVNNKIVSVCASRNLTPDTGYIVYRYGVPGKVELVYPKELRNPRDFFSYASGYAHYESQTSLSFLNKPYRYTVFYHEYTKTVFNPSYIKGEADRQRTGISVRNRGKIIFQKMCKGSSFYITTKFYSGNTPISIAHNWGTNFVFGYYSPPGLKLPFDEFVDEVVTNESRK